MRKLLFFAISVALTVGSTRAADPSPPPISAKELAAKLDAIGQGNTSIRTQLEVWTNGGGKRVFQLLIKERRTKSATDIVYTVLWPNDQKGKAVILRQKAGEAPTGSVIEPPNKVRTLQASEMNEGLFDSDLSYQDAVENFFAWKNQEILGTQVVDNVKCQILESKPDSTSQTIYGKVRSWIDPARLVPLRIEKYSPAGELVRRIDTDRVTRDEKHNNIPAGLVVHGPRKNTVTRLNGAGIKQDVNLTNADFTAAAVLP